MLIINILPNHVHHSYQSNSTHSKHAFLPNPIRIPSALTNSLSSNQTKNLSLVSYNFSIPNNFTETSKCDKLRSSSARRLAVPHCRQAVHHRTQKSSTLEVSPGGAFSVAKQFLNRYLDFSNRHAKWKEKFNYHSRQINNH